MQIHYMPDLDLMAYEVTRCGRPVTGATEISSDVDDVTCKTCIAGLQSDHVAEAVALGLAREVAGTPTVEPETAYPVNSSRCESYSKSGQQCEAIGDHEVHQNGTRSWVTSGRPQAKDGKTWYCGNGSCAGAPERHHELDCPDDFTRLVTRALLTAGRSRGAMYRGLSQIRFLTEAIEELEAARLIVIERERQDNNASWAQIGEQLGTSKQGAQQKYGRKKATAVDAGDDSQPQLDL